MADPEQRATTDQLQQTERALSLAAAKVPRTSSTAQPQPPMAPRDQQGPGPRSRREGAGPNTAHGRRAIGGAGGGAPTGFPRTDRARGRQGMMYLIPAAFLMSNRFLKFLVGSAAGIVILAGLIAAGVFAVGVWRSMSYQAAQKKCVTATAYGASSYVRKADRERYTTFVLPSEKLYGNDAYEACMDDEGH